MTIASILSDLWRGGLLKPPPPPPPPATQAQELQKSQGRIGLTVNSELKLTHFRATGPWNWPTTAREISQPYKNNYLLTEGEDCMENNKMIEALMYQRAKAEVWYSRKDRTFEVNKYFILRKR